MNAETSKSCPVFSKKRRYRALQEYGVFPYARFIGIWKVPRLVTEFFEDVFLSQPLSSSLSRQVVRSFGPYSIALAYPPPLTSCAGTSFRIRSLVLAKDRHVDFHSTFKKRLAM